MSKNEKVDLLLATIEAECDGLITLMREFISDGWGLLGKPTPEQIAAAMLMEAGGNDPDHTEEYRTELRTHAFRILEAAGHKRPEST